MIFPLTMCGQCTYVTDEVTGVLQLKRLLLFLIRFSLSLPGVLPVLPPLFSFLFLLCFFIFPSLLLLLLLLFDLPFVCYRAGGKILPTRTELWTIKRRDLDEQLIRWDDWAKSTNLSDARYTGRVCERANALLSTAESAMRGMAADEASEWVNE